MKKFLATITFLLIGGLLLVEAQNVKITGTVTSSDDGSPLPGVSVLVKGTTIGVATNINGKYEISVPSSATTLEFSSIGYSTQAVEIAGRSIIDVVLASASEQIEEVVVTALGISREKKSLGYAVQDVKGEELAKVRTTNVINSLTGRVAGVQISSASGQMGGGAKINIRGNTSLTKNNQPLFVVDGVPLDNTDYSYGATGRVGYDLGNLAADINPDDVESMSILKGASATALYGSRAANGVVMVTTKKGAKGSDNTIGVSVNSSVTFDKATYYPIYQKLYGGGYVFTPTKINGEEYLTLDYDTDESWGPRYDESIKVLQYNAFDEWDTEHYLQPTPWVYPEHDYTYFFKMGQAFQNNVSVSSGNENSTFRLSYTNMDVKGITPNSSLKRNTVNLNASSKVSKFLDGWFTANYVQNQAIGRPETGYGDRNPSQKMWQWIHTQLDYKDMEDYLNPDGTQRSWNRISWKNPTPAYTDNPYWSVYKNYQSDRRDRVYGNAGVNIHIIPGLTLTGRVGMDFYKMLAEERMAVGSQKTPNYTQDVNSFMELNTELFLNFEKRMANERLGIAAIVGTNRLDQKTWRNGGTTVGGLVTPNMYNLMNSVSQALVYDARSWKRINSIYANVSLDFDRMIFLELTGRNDWSSTLPKENNSYFYPSATLSVLLSEFGFLKGNEILSYAKLRGGIAQVGNDTGPYETINWINPSTVFGSDTRQTLPFTYNYPELRPEKTMSWEIGTELKFLQNRIGLDLSYFYKSTTDQIISTEISAARGYYHQIINAGKMTNQGLEIALSATPVQVAGFSWDLMLNMGTLKNKVVEIAEGLDWISLGGGPFKVQTGAYVGESYPMIYGTDYVYDDAGNKLVDKYGFYQTSEIKPLASATPNFTAGLTNTFSFKGLELSVLIDMQRGGHMYYTSYMWGMYSGILEESAAINENGKNIRDDPADGGGVCVDGVYGERDADGNVRYFDADGKTSSSPIRNESRIEAEDYAGWHYDGVDMQNVFSTNFIKLREIRLGYTLPAKITGPIKNVKVSAFARNLAIWGRACKHFDPEYLQMAGSNAQGIEGGYQPSTITFGFGLNFNF